ncbi:MAG: EVE domain-containing protein [Planctomycetes bacterium]|nr:EVE domain-containing protein [Planctomycetota bacterium]
MEIDISPPPIVSPTPKYFLAVLNSDNYDWSSDTANQGSYGVSESLAARARAVQPGSRLVCYLTGDQLWVGILEVMTVCVPDNDPKWNGYVNRFGVKPLAWLTRDHAVRHKDDVVWNHLSFTMGLPKDTPTTSGQFAGSLRSLEYGDGRYLEDLLVRQATVQNATLSGG